MKPRFSVVAPIYNEESLIEEFYRRVHAVMESLGEPWELVLVDDGSRDRSPDLLDQFHAQDPEHVASLTNLGRLYVTWGRFDQAVPLLRRAAGRQPSSALYNALAEAEARRGDRRQAEHWLRRSLELDENQPDVRRRLAELERSG